MLTGDSQLGLQQMGQSHGGRSLGTRSSYRGRRDEGPSTSAGTSAQPSDDFSIRFSYFQLARATNFFPHHRRIGVGDFGPVFKARLDIAGSGIRTLAIKQLNRYSLQGTKEFLVEVLMLLLLRHPNIVGLVGYCYQEHHRIIVYEYLPLRSLDFRLHDLTPEMQPLDWNTRMKIATGVAKGLHYLHNEAIPPVIYRDMKSSNVLLDKEFHPKLSDFGLAIFVPEGARSDVSTRVMGTPAYSEYASTGKLSFKSDVCSYGVLLLEIITGEEVFDATRGYGKELLVNWVCDDLSFQNNAELADPLLSGRFPGSIFSKVMKVALMCTQRDPDLPPSMTDVVYAMEFLSSEPYDPNADQGRYILEPFDDDAKTRYARADRFNRSLQLSRLC